jgi:THUMP domain-containing protein
VFGFQLKTLRTWLRDRGVGRLTIKKRGTAVEPEQLRRQLRLDGDDEATIVLTRVGGRQSVVAVRPVR